ncbi:MULTISPECIES: chemotaxis protein CheW [Giesbergeria]|uniref:Chemotaxis protein CheW n=1 Tax=Giesbergeria sinuosa TaxID=80883 RepID=A0ABV9QER3_9BURK
MSASDPLALVAGTTPAVPSRNAALALGHGAPPPKKHLGFTLNGEIYAIAIEQIKEIIGFRPMTTVPMMPAYLRGIINLRGMVVPVIDLARRFGQDPTPVGKRSCIVILEIPLYPEMPEQRHTMGLVVDMVNAVLDISPAVIEPAPSFGINIRPDFLHGMAKIKDKFVLLLNIQRVIMLEELNALRSLARKDV